MMATTVDRHKDIVGIVLVPPVVQNSLVSVLRELHVSHMASPFRWNICSSQSSARNISSCNPLRTLRSNNQGKSLTLPDNQHEAECDFAGIDGTLLDTRAMAEKSGVGNVHGENRFEVSRELRRSDRAPETVVEGSTGFPYSCEDCSHYHGVRRDDPFWQAKRSKARFGVGQSFNRL
jgi:hypothetical protein